MDKNYHVNFSCIGCLGQEQVSGKVIEKGPKVGRLFVFQFIPNHLSLACNNVLNSYEDWHKKFGHPNFSILSHLYKTSLLEIKNVVSNAFVSCLVRKLGKSKTLHFSIGVRRASTCFEVILSDMWGKSHAVSHIHYKYFVTFIDDYSRFIWIYFLGLNLECFLCLRNFLHMLKLNFKLVLKNFALTLVVSTRLMIVRNTLKKDILSQLSCPIPLNKI